MTPALVTLRALAEAAEKARAEVIRASAASHAARATCGIRADIVALDAERDAIRAIYAAGNAERDYIAAASPVVVIGLIDEIDRLRALLTVPAAPGKDQP